MIHLLLLHTARYMERLLLLKKNSPDLNAIVQDAVKVISFRVAHSIPVFLQIYVMKWNQSLRLFYRIVKL